MHAILSRLSAPTFAFAIGLLSFGFLFATHSTPQAKAAPGNAIIAPVAHVSTQIAPDAPQLAYHECVVGRVHEWVDNFSQPTTSGGSIMIGCSNPAGDIQFFAQPLTDTKRAARILSIALTAKALNKSLGIDYYEDAATVTGCSAGNCRNIARLFLVE